MAVSGEEVKRSNGRVMLVEGVYRGEDDRRERGGTWTVGTWTVGHVEGRARGRWGTWRVGGGVMLVEGVYREEDDRRVGGTWKVGTWTVGHVEGRRGCHADRVCI